MEPILFQLLDRIRSTGVLGWLPEAEADRMRRTVAAYESEVIAGILLLNQHVALDLRARHARGPEDYLKLLRELGTLAHGAFPLTDTGAAWAEHDPQMIQLSFTLASRSYSARVPVYSHQAIDADTLIRAANQALAEAGAPGRFYALAHVTREQHLRQVGVVFLTPEQRAALLALNPVLLPWADDEASVRPAAQALAYLDTLEALGLLAHLSADERAGVRGVVAQRTVTSLPSILYDVPGLVAVIDAEMLERHRIAEQYAALLVEVASLARGAAVLRDVAVRVEPPLEEERPCIAVSFSIGARGYATTLRYLGEWVDLGFVALINQALADAGVDGRIASIDTGDQAFGLIFLTAAQRAAVLGQGLFPLHEDRSGGTDGA